VLQSLNAASIRTKRRLQTSATATNTTTTFATVAEVCKRHLLRSDDGAMRAVVL
jgi:hypothetical protein